MVSVRRLVKGEEKRRRLEMEVRGEEEEVKEGSEVRGESVSAPALLEQNFKFCVPLTLGGNYVRTPLDLSVLDAYKF